MIKKVIKNYTVEGGEKKANPQQVTPKIIKKSALTKNSKTIDHTKVEKIPEITVHKNDMGVISSVDVKCACGEEFVLKFEYE